MIKLLFVKYMMPRFGWPQYRDWSIVLQNGGDIAFEIWQTPTGGSSTLLVHPGVFDDNQWHLLCASFNPADGPFGEIKINIDGGAPLSALLTAPPCVAAANGGVAILSTGAQYDGGAGSYNWWPMVEGCVDECGIWSEDVLADYPLVSDKIWNDGCPADLTAPGGPTDHVVLSRWYRMGRCTDRQCRTWNDH